MCEHCFYPMIPSVTYAAKSLKYSLSPDVSLNLKESAQNENVKLAQPVVKKAIHEGLRGVLKLEKIEPTHCRRFALALYVKDHYYVTTGLLNDETDEVFVRIRELEKTYFYYFHMMKIALEEAGIEYEIEFLDK